MKSLHVAVIHNGRATLPAKVRRAIGLKPGDKVSFIVDRGEVKLVRRGGVVERTAGMLKGRRRARTAERLREAAEMAIAEEAVERATGRSRPGKRGRAD